MPHLYARRAIQELSGKALVLGATRLPRVDGVVQVQPQHAGVPE
jgi:hypothetical protein